MGLKKSVLLSNQGLVKINQTITPVKIFQTTLQNVSIHLFQLPINFAKLYQLMSAN